MECNKDCFNCIYTDCTYDKLEESDVIEQNNYSKDLKHHSTPQQLKDAKNYYIKHRDQCLEKNRNYYNTHKEKFREYERRRRIEHPVSKEKQHEYYIRWRDKKRREQNGEC